MERGNPGSPPGANATATGWSIAEREGVLPFGQLQIELHVWNQRFQDFLEWWELLEVSGLRPFHNEVRPARVWIGEWGTALIMAL